MEFGDASHLVADADARGHEERSARLLELADILGDEDVGFSGQAAVWLFDDVKATWIYGYFTATVLAAYAFCTHQLAGLVRMLPDDPDLPQAVAALDEIAATCEACGLIDIDLRARLLALHDRATMYLTAGLHDYEALVERHALEAQLFTEEHSLLADARAALLCAAALLHRRA